MKTRDNKTDRRSMRSKKAILDALQVLILQKQIKDISVTDIIQQANIGRTTFYAHFEDMADLQRFIFSRLLKQIEQETELWLANQDKPADIYQSLIPSLALFKIAAEKHAIFKTTAESPHYGLRDLIPPLIIRFETQLDEMGITNPEAAPTRRTIALYLISGLIALLIDWLKHDMPQSPENINKTFQKLAKPNLKLLIS